MVARADRLAKKTGLSWVPVAIYIAAVVVVGGGLFAWDYAYRRKAEEALRPPPPDVLAKNLVENIIGRGTAKDVKAGEAAGSGGGTTVARPAPHPRAGARERRVG